MLANTLITCSYRRLFTEQHNLKCLISQCGRDSLFSVPVVQLVPLHQALPMRARPPSSSANPDLALHDHARRHIRRLIGVALAYFSEREEDNLKLVRAHLLTLLDARPSQ